MNNESIMFNRSQPEEQLNAAACDEIPRYALDGKFKTFL